MSKIGIIVAVIIIVVAAFAGGLGYYFGYEMASYLIGGGVSAVISAVVTVLVYSYFERKNIRKRVRNALIYELEKNLNQLKDLDKIDEEILPVFTSVYDSINILDPEFVAEIEKNTNWKLSEVYGFLQILSELNKARIFGLSWVTKENKQDFIEESKKYIKDMKDIYEYLKEIEIY